MKEKDVVYKKTDILKRPIKYELVYLGKHYSIILNIDNPWKVKIYEKHSTSDLTLNKEEIYAYNDNIKKGALVKCILNKIEIKEGLVLDVHDVYVKVLIGNKKIRISRKSIVSID